MDLTEIENEVADYAFKYLHIVSRVKYFGVTNLNSLEVTPNFRSFGRIDGDDILHNYVIQYKRVYLEKTKEEPTRIIIKNSWLSSLHGKLEIPLVLIDCKLFINTDDLESFTFEYVENTHIEMLGKALSKIPIFKHCVFVGTTEFRPSEQGTMKYFDIHDTISSSVLLGEVISNGRMYFSNCRMNILIAHDDLVLDDCHINTLVLSGSTNSIHVYKTTLDNCHFNDCKFVGGSIFEDVKFQYPISFNNAEFLNSNVNFHNIEFSDLKSEKAIGSFRTLTRLCQNAGYEHGAILFHGFELETFYNLYLKSKTSIKLWPEKVSSVFHKHVTDYGRDPILPIFWLLILFPIIALAHIFCGEGGFISLAWSLSDSLGPLVFALPKSLAATHVELSLIESWKQIDFRHTLSFLLRFIHILLSSVLWFLIIFMIRRRFKL